MLELAENKKFLGGQVGVISTLHTWGQNLSFHPHIHMMIPGVALSRSGIEVYKCPKNFFLPVKLMAKIFRAKFLSSLKLLYSQNDIHFDEGKDSFQELIDQLFKVEWVVYSKKPFASTWHLIRYLSNYTHKVAISNSRLISMDNGIVKFRYKDYRDNLQKVIELPATEFLRRFFMHVLPGGFVRIRHYGILSNANRNKKLILVKALLGAIVSKSPPKSAHQLFFELTGRSFLHCPCCGGELKPFNCMNQSTE